MCRSINRWYSKGIRQPNLKGEGAAMEGRRNLLHNSQERKPFEDLKIKSRRKRGKGITPREKKSPSEGAKENLRLRH